MWIVGKFMAPITKASFVKMVKFPTQLLRHNLNRSTAERERERESSISSFSSQLIFPYSKDTRKIYRNTLSELTVCWIAECISSSAPLGHTRWMIPQGDFFLFFALELHWFGSSRQMSHMCWTVLNDFAIPFPFKLLLLFLSDTCLNQCLPLQVMGWMYWGAHRTASQIH